MIKNVIGFLNLYNSPNLGPLTEKRTLGSTSFLGRFALMDFPLSCFTNSGIDGINILVKDNFRSVSKHVGSLKTWVNNTKRGMQNILLNEKGIRNPKDNTDLKCLLQNDWVLLENKPDAIILLSAHILTQMDLRPIIDKHFENEADITLIYKNIDDADKSFSSSNILKIKDGYVTSYKRNNQKVKNANVSLEAYIISVSALQMIFHNKEYMKLPSLKKVIEKIVSSKAMKVNAYEYQGYARCFDSFKHFVDYSFELLNYDVSKTLFGKTTNKDAWPIYTLTHNTPPTLYGEKANIKNSFIANGAFIEGTVENSIISRYVTVAKGAVVKNSIILTGTVIEKGAKVNNAVIDKYSLISSKQSVTGKKESPIYLEQGCVVK